MRKRSKTPKKLDLDKQTVRQLEADKLGAVQGGREYPTANCVGH